MEKPALALSLRWLMDLSELGNVRFAPHHHLHRITGAFRRRQRILLDLLRERRLEVRRNQDLCGEDNICDSPPLLSSIHTITQSKQVLLHSAFLYRLPYLYEQSISSELL
jgi:hypothetical protein